MILIYSFFKKLVKPTRVIVAAIGLFVVVVLAGVAIFAIIKGCNKIQFQIWPLGFSFECPGYSDTNNKLPINIKAPPPLSPVKPPNPIHEIREKPKSKPDNSPKINTNITTSLPLKKLQEKWYGKGLTIIISANDNSSLDKKTIYNFIVPSGIGGKNEIIGEWCKKNKACIICKFNHPTDYKKATAITISLTTIASANSYRYSYITRQEIQTPFEKTWEGYACKK